MPLTDALPWAESRKELRERVEKYLDQLARGYGNAIPPRLPYQVVRILPTTPDERREYQRSSVDLGPHLDEALDEVFGEGER